MKTTFIAEVKTQSLSGWRSSWTWDELFELANRHGDMLSIHTDPRWGGSLELIAKARQLTDKPILAKGIHEDDSQVQRALDRGADKVLVVGRVPAQGLIEHCLLEPLNLEQLNEYPEEAKVVWNSRDLATHGHKNETFEDARSRWAGWLCQASNIRTLLDVHESADAVLVGTHLFQFIQML